VRRFVGSLRPGGPPPDADAWAATHLVPGEVEVWHRMSDADRRHAVGVARRVVARLGPDVGRPVVAAALLHDAGKVASGLGTFARVGATLAGRRARGRWATYRDHPVIGARLLDAAGSDPLTVAWTREHHLPRDRWTVDRRVADALKEADDD
jgi:hypothetical protein